MNNSDVTDRALPSRATISEATISEATISEATISEATISEATISEATISEATISKAIPEYPLLLDVMYDGVHYVFKNTEEMVTHIAFLERKKKIIQRVRERYQNNQMVVDAE